MPMNLPNKLTLLRIALVPAFLVLYVNSPQWGLNFRYAAFLVFAAASGTDALDGWIARKYNLITNFGKLMDPLADKLLVCAAMVAMTGLGEMPSWASILVISRELIITGFRMMALEQNFVMAASPLGKIKTIVQVVMILAVLLPFIPKSAVTLLIWLTAILTVASAAEYIIKNREILKEKGAKA